MAANNNSTGSSDNITANKNNSRNFMLLAFSLITIFLLAGTLYVWVERMHQNTILVKLDERLSITSEHRSEQLSQWLEHWVRTGNQIILSQNFANKISGATSNEADVGSKQINLTSLFQLSEIYSSALYDNQGKILAPNNLSIQVTEDWKEKVDAVIKKKTVHIGTFTYRNKNWYVEVGLPILNESSELVGVYIMSVNATEIIAKVLKNRTSSNQSYDQMAILQKEGTDWYGISANQMNQPVKLSHNPEKFYSNNKEKLQEKPFPISNQPSFSRGSNISNMDAVFISGNAIEFALNDKDNSRFLMIFVVITVALASAGFLIALHYRELGKENTQLAEQFRNLAGQIDAYRRLLEGINGAIPELIGLKRLDGTYIYVNPSFAEAIGRPVEQIIGQTDHALFGHGTGKRLEQSDHRACQEGAVRNIEEQVYFGEQLRHLEISKVALKREDGEVDGIVSVARDVTELVESRRKREAATRHTISALVRAVEMSDPYLAGHSRLMQGFAMLTGRALSMSAEEISTLEIASNLSQIGKIFIPRDILAKPERLTEEEIQIMQTHIEHAANVLKDVDFNLPVAETIYQMYERLDGSGYPNGLRSEKISLAARVLGVCDVFCARIEPRSYRAAISAEKILSILAENSQKYDERVVQALAEVVRTLEGEKLLLAADSI